MYYRTINAGCSSDECDCSSQSGRQFLTADEKIERLQEYHDWLSSEAKGVSEAIERLKKK